MNTYEFNISGTHCASCKIFIEDSLGEENFVQNAKVDLKREILQIRTNSTESLEELAKILTDKIKSHGYTVSVEKIVREKKKENEIWIALPVGLLILFLFFILQKSGILNVGMGGELKPLTSFMVGLIASVSSCLAVVGGLVLSLSAKISQDKKSDTKTFLLFHAGRLLSFAMLGGVLGVVGGAIGVNFTLTSILGILASIVMIGLGLNLVGALEQKKVTMPLGIFNFFRKMEHKTFSPLVIGFATFFLPCGFTQAMQISAISSGSFVSGLIIMLSFAIGTLPVLAMLSFGSASFAQSRHSVLFFKSAGVVVVGLGMFALLSGLAGLGLIPPLFNI